MTARRGLLLGVVLLAGCTAMMAGGEGGTPAMEWQGGRLYAGGELSREPVPFADPTVSRLASGQTRVSVIVPGGSMVATYSWHIHEGTCGSNGPIVGSPDDYGALASDPQAVASQALELDLTLDPHRAYHIDLLHEGMGVVACGDLTRPSARPRRTRPLRADPVLGRLASTGAAG